jgi:hypothetical protein
LIASLPGPEQRLKKISVAALEETLSADAQQSPLRAIATPPTSDIPDHWRGRIRDRATSPAAAPDDQITPAGNRHVVGMVNQPANRRLPAMIDEVAGNLRRRARGQRIDVRLVASSSAAAARHRRSSSALGGLHSCQKGFSPMR